MPRPSDLGLTVESLLGRRGPELGPLTGAPYGDTAGDIRRRRPNFGGLKCGGTEGEPAEEKNWRHFSCGNERGRIAAFLATRLPPSYRFREGFRQGVRQERRKNEEEQGARSATIACRRKRVRVYAAWVKLRWLPQPPPPRQPKEDGPAEIYIRDIYTMCIYIGCRCCLRNRRHHHRHWRRYRRLWMGIESYGLRD